MKIIALGTGTSQGIPIIGCQCEVCTSADPADRRLRSSVYIESNEAKVLIDIGPDFRSQFLQNKLTTIDLILLTHEHNDHIIGLDDIRAINFTQQKSIPIFSSNRVIDTIKQRFAYVFSKEPYPGLPQIELNIIDDKSFQYKDLKISPINIKHGQLDIWGFRINDFAYITDASTIPEEEYSKLKNVKVLIINALRQAKHYSHFNLEGCLEAIKRINPSKAYITHISHNMGKTAEWKKLLPAGVSPLQDMMTIEI